MRSMFLRSLSVLAFTLAVPLAGCSDDSGTVILTSSPTAVDFGEAVIGQRAVTSLSISNSGDGVASLTEPTFASGSAATIGIEARPWPYNLPAGASLALQVTYSPTAVGSDQATLVFSREGSDGPEELLHVLEARVLRIPSPHHAG